MNQIFKDDITGRIKYDKKIHLFAQPFGYLIRACRWEIPPTDELLDIGKPITCENCKNFLLRRGQFEKDY